jgi:hypothetical protein
MKIWQTCLVVLFAVFSMWRAKEAAAHDFVTLPFSNGFERSGFFSNLLITGTTSYCSEVTNRPPPAP